MHTTILARVAGMLAHLLEGQGHSLWLPRRTLSLTRGYESNFDALDLVSGYERSSAICCGGASTIASLTR